MLLGLYTVFRDVMFIVYQFCMINIGDMKSSVSRSKNSTFSQARCASALSCSNMWKSNYPHKYLNAIAFFVTVTVKLQTLITNEPDLSPLEQGSNWQHQLMRLASLYSWHIMTSALRHD